MAAWRFHGAVGVDFISLESLLSLDDDDMINALEKVLSRHFPLFEMLLLHDAIILCLG